MFVAVGPLPDVSRCSKIRHETILVSKFPGLPAQKRQRKKGERPSCDGRHSGLGGFGPIFLPDPTGWSALHRRQEEHCVFVCAVPNDASELGKMCDLERRLFGNLAFPFHAACNFFAKRPEIFNFVRDRHGDVVAYTSVFPLRPQWSKALICGDITEAELNADMIFGRNDRHDGLQVYVSSVVVDPKFDPILKSILIAGLMSFRIRQLRNASMQRVSAIMTIATSRGERLARRLGAKRLNGGASRKDGLDVFGCDVTSNLLYQEVIGAVKRFSFGKDAMLHFDFSSCGERSNDAEAGMSCMPQVQAL